MSSSILNVTFDCSDAASMARFWSEVTLWPCSKQEMPGNPYWVVGAPDGVGPQLVVVGVMEGKTVKNRVHLDLVPRDGTQAEEVSRLKSFGALVIDDRRGVEPGGWVVMTDLEGNEFCLEGGGD